MTDLNTRMSEQLRFTADEIEREAKRRADQLRAMADGLVKHQEPMQVPQDFRPGGVFHFCQPQPMPIRTFDDEAESGRYGSGGLSAGL